jgi:hypothetical protein
MGTRGAVATMVAAAIALASADRVDRSGVLGDLMQSP